MFVEGIGVGDVAVRLTADEFRLLAEVCHKSDVGVLDGRDQEVIALATTFSVLSVLGYGTELMRLNDFQTLIDKMDLVAFNGTQWLGPRKRTWGPTKDGNLPMSVVDRMYQEKLRKRARKMQGEPSKPPEEGSRTG